MTRLRLGRKIALHIDVPLLASSQEDAMALSQVFQVLDEAGAPACAKAFILNLYKATLRGSRVKMSPEAFQNGTDTKHAREKGIIRQLDDRAVVFTHKGETLLQ